MDSWAGQLDDIPFHVYAMKEPDYVMSLMLSYGTNDRLNGKETQQDWKDGATNMSKRLKYPEVVHNHFQYCHAVDDHNAKWHSLISIEVVWATKQWPNRVFSFLLLITEVNCFLAESYFTGRKSDSMLDFRKRLSFKLIENAYMKEEDRVEHHRSARIRERIGHGLVSLPAWKKFSGGHLITSVSKYPQKKCSRCCCKVQTYCVCSPGVPLCSHCLASHIKDCENDSC